MILGPARDFSLQEPESVVAPVTVGCAGRVGSRFWHALTTPHKASTVRQTGSDFMRTPPLRTCTTTLAWVSPDDLRTQVHEALLHDWRLLARILHLLE